MWTSVHNSRIDRVRAECPLTFPMECSGIGLFHQSTSLTHRPVLCEWPHWVQHGLKTFSMKRAPSEFCIGEPTGIHVPMSFDSPFRCVEVLGTKPSVKTKRVLGTLLPGHANYNVMCGLPLSRFLVRDLENEASSSSVLQELVFIRAIGEKPLG